MPHKRPLTIQDQAMNTLREGLLSRRWAGVLPGVRPLAKELGVSYGTLQKALKRLEAEGLLSGKGARFSREVTPSAADPLSPSTLRVGILINEPLAAEGTWNQALLLGILHALTEAGHRPFFATKTMHALRHEPGSIRMMMTDGAADAWVVFNSGRPLLEELVAKFAKPVLAVGGPADGLNIAKVAVSWQKAVREAMRRLITKGHRRIVWVLSSQKRDFRRSAAVNAFIEELTAAGINPGPYHLPDWEQSREGFNALLHSLFALTPPTALLLSDVRQVCAVHAFLAARKIPPSDLALVFLASDPAIDWVTPAPVRIRYDNAELIERVAAWVATLAAGGRDTAQVYCEAHLVEGDGFNPPPKG